jgi:hypothetical protein
VYSVLRSIFGKQKSEVEPLVTKVFSRKDLLIPDELEMWEYVSNSIAVAGEVPGERLFLDKFPDSEVFITGSAIFSLHDAKVHLDLLIETRANATTAAEVQRLSTQISESGFTAEIFDKIRRLRGGQSSESGFSCSVPGCRCAIPNNYKCLRRIYEMRASRPTGLFTYIEAIDKAIGGMAEGSLNTVMGFTGSFKTTFGVNLAYNNAIKLGYNIAYLSFEVSREDLWFHLISRHSFDPKFDRYPYIPHDRIRRCELTAEELDYMSNVIVPDFEQSTGKIVVLQPSDFKSRDPDDIYSKLEEVDDAVGGIDAFVWDHIQMFKFGAGRFRSRDEKETMNAWVNQFMNWALDFRGRKTIQVLLAQTNREGWKRAVKHGGIYDLTALAEVNEGERASSRVMSIYTDDALKASKECKVQLLKSRFGAPVPDPITVLVEPEACVFPADLATNSLIPTVDEFDVMFKDSF